MNYAEKERAALSRRFLSKRYGLSLARWAARRRQAWRIDESWTIERLHAHFETVRKEGSWELLREPADVAQLDEWLRAHMDCTPRRARSYAGVKQLGIDEIADRFRAERPNLTRPQLRTVLHRAARKGVIARVSRGSYANTREHESFDRLTAEYNDLSYERWQLRHERNRLVLMAHYLLVHLPAYRKAMQFGLSDRAYFYALNQGLEPLAPEEPEEFPRNVQW